MYERYSAKKEWAKEQLRGAAVPEVTSRGIVSVFSTWLNMMPADVDEQRQALQIFNDLVAGRAITYVAPGSEPENWQTVRLGNVRRGDYVRILTDAYTGDAGLCHNGRRGPVLRVSNGDVIVRYDDGLMPPSGELGAHHSPYKLEKRVT
jgi:hypothetical protein